jgi:hypothetical protein
MAGSFRSIRRARPRRSTWCWKHACRSYGGFGRPTMRGDVLERGAGKAVARRRRLGRKDGNGNRGRLAAHAGAGLAPKRPTVTATQPTPCPQLPLAGTQPRHGAHWQRRPPSDGPGALRRLPVVGNAREQAPQLDGGRQLAVLIEDGADRGGIGFGDDEHGGRMGGAHCGRQAGVIGGGRGAVARVAPVAAAGITSLLCLGVGGGKKIRAYPATSSFLCFNGQRATDRM